MLCHVLPNLSHFCEQSTNGSDGSELPELSCSLRQECSVIAVVIKGFQLFQVLVSLSPTLSFPIVPMESFASQQQ